MSLGKWWPAKVGFMRFLAMSLVLVKTSHYWAYLRIPHLLGGQTVSSRGQPCMRVTPLLGYKRYETSTQFAKQNPPDLQSWLLSV